MESASAQSILEERFPGVAARLRGISPAGVSVPLDPQLCALWAQKQIKAPQRNVLYLVNGFGPHLLSLLPRLDASAVLVVYEASLGRLRAALESPDMAIVLADERVSLFAGPQSPKDFERLHHLPVVRVGEAFPLRFSPAWQLDAAAYEAFYEEFAKQLKVVQLLHKANLNDSLFWQATSLQNLATHAQAPDVECLKGLFPELPVILVGAGPSLDEADRFLKAARDRALIIAVNSSYHKLRKIGVIPHLVLAADPREATMRGFSGQPVDGGVYLVSPFIVNTQVPPLFKGRAFSWSGENNYLVHILRRRLGLSGGTLLLEKGTVSVSVADLAALLGCKRLILVGQDMAIKPDGTTHTKDSFYGGYKVEETVFDKAVRWVEGNAVEKVPTLNNLYVYLKTFEQWVEAHPEIEVINTARAGAKIAGAAYRPYDAAREFLSPTPIDIDLRLEEAFENAPERALAPRLWKEALNPTLNFARKLYDMALPAALAIEGLPERYFQPSYQESKEIKEINALGLAINALIDGHPEDYRVMLEGRLKKRLLDYQLVCSTLEGASSFAQELLQNKEFYWALVEGIEPMLSLMEEKQKDEVPA